MANVSPRGQDRFEAGADRDDAADARDVAAQRRDEAADRRDDESTAAGEYGGVVVDDLHALAGELRRSVRDHLARIETTTTEAAVPRDLGARALSHLRAHGAEQRELIDAGREAIMALLDEIDAEIRHDRTELARLARNRQASAQDRADSADDRSAAAHDRDKSYEDREQAAVEHEERRPPEPVHDRDGNAHELRTATSRQRIQDSRDLLTRKHNSSDSEPATGEGASRPRHAP